MASTGKYLLDEPLNKTDIDSSEVSAIFNTLETQLSSQKDLLNQNNYRDNNLNSNSSHANGNIIYTSVAIGSDLLTSNGQQQHQKLNHHQLSSGENQIFSSNNNISGFINNNLNDKNDCVISNNQVVVTDPQQVVHSEGNNNTVANRISSVPLPSQNFQQLQQQQHHRQQNFNNHRNNQSFQQLQNMPKSNEPIKIAYPSNTNQQQHQQQQVSSHSLQGTHHTIVTMNSSQQTTGNRVTFTSQSLPNGTINITSQPQQIMHAVSAAGLPTATTIKTITTGIVGGVGQPAQQNQNNPGTGTQTLGNQQNIVGTPMLPGNSNIVQIVGVRPTTPTQNQQKNVAAPMPRVVIGGPHMVGTRPASPAITLSALQSGQSGPALILKTENGYQLLRVQPPPSTPVATQNIQTSSGNQTIRLQTVPAQSIATSATSLVVNSVTSTNATQVLASQANTTIQPTVASVAPVPALAQSSTHHQTQQSQVQQHHHQQQTQTQQQTQAQQQHHVIQQQQQQQQHQHHQQVTQHQSQQQQTVSTSSGTTQTTQNAVSQKKNILQGNTKEKCRKFLANLIELSSREPKQVEKSVRTLIQELVDANVEPEEFCDRLERLLNASPQPCLIGFLKKSLPLLRQSLYTKELVIEGIKPPPQHVVNIIGSTTLTQQLPRIQAQIRPIGQQTTTIGQTQVRMVTQAKGSIPVGQTTITKHTTGGVRIQGPIQAGGITASGPRLMNAQIRPIGVNAATANLVQSSNIQSPPALQPVSGTQTVFTSQPNIVQIRTSSAVNRTPASVQIRATAPVVRATAPSSKNSATIAVTQVKVGQTQIKAVPVQSTTPVTTTTAQNSTTTTTPVSSTTTTASTGSNKVVTVKAQSAQQQSTKKEPKEKEKKVTSTASSFFQQSSMSVSSSMYGDDDINDVAAMGGVNLAEESQKILGSTEMIGTQIRSCKDEVFLHLPALLSRIRQIVAEKSMEEPNQEVAVLISHACQERLKNIVEKLAVIAEHRIDIIKVDPRYEITKDVRGQLKFLEELDKAEQKRHEEQEREMLLRAAKSRSKIEDPEQAKLKAKAKEMQRAEMEELRQRDANMTALQAIGPRKKPKLDGDATSLSTQSGTSGVGASGISPAPLRPRIKRVNMRDMLFFMEQEKEFMRSTMLYKAYLK